MHLDFQSGVSKVIRGFGIMLKYTTLFLGLFVFSFDEGDVVGGINPMRIMTSLSVINFIKAK